MSLFVHSMFRTGSTYVAERLASDPQNLVFYEPFHGVLAQSPRRRQEATGAVREHLKHPELPGGYWAAFDPTLTPASRHLRRLTRRRFGLYDVYNGAHTDALAYLRCCEDVADALGKRAVFGFCRSGLQVEGLRVLGGQHIHLTRAPRHQFQSYQTTRYFMASTVLQLLSSRRYGALAAEILKLPKSLSAVIVPLARGLMPARVVARLGRELQARVGSHERYGGFYLAWRLSNDHATAHCDATFSLTELAHDTTKRDAIAQTSGITFDALKAIDDGPLTLDLPFEDIERDVERALA